MSLSYLVDTDWIIHYLNGNRNIVERLKSLKKEEGLGISIISLASFMKVFITQRIDRAMKKV